MQFIVIEIAPSGTKDVVLNPDSAATSVSHSRVEGPPPGYLERDPSRWLRGADRSCRPDPGNHEPYQHRMARQRYLADTLHPAGFI